VENIARKFLTKIHHVEHYCKLPEEGSDVIFGSVFSYKQACLYGCEINEQYYPKPWQWVLLTGNFFHYFTSPMYRIDPLPGDPFPFDHRYAHVSGIHSAADRFTICTWFILKKPVSLAHILKRLYEIFDKTEILELDSDIMPGFFWEKFHI
jgi:hypothetical protein